MLVHSLHRCNVCTTEDVISWHSIGTPVASKQHKLPRHSFLTLSGVFSISDVQEQVEMFRDSQLTAGVFVGVSA
jgi:hypothetical protein